MARSSLGDDFPETCYLHFAFLKDYLVSSAKYYEIKCKSFIN